MAEDLVIVGGGVMGWVGRVLCELALQQGTVYDIGRFRPARFDQEGFDDAAIDARPAAAAR